MISDIDNSCRVILLNKFHCYKSQTDTDTAVDFSFVVYNTKKIMKCEGTQVCLLQLTYSKTFFSSTVFFNIDYYM